MTPNAARVADDAPADPHGFSARKHFLGLMLIGVAAIGVSVLLPSEVTAPAADTAIHASKVHRTSASATAKNIAPAQIAGNASGSTDQPFDYFPAQFPTPGGEIGEQAPTF
jgi:hypothetical protein